MKITKEYGYGVWAEVDLYHETLWYKIHSPQEPTIYGEFDSELEVEAEDLMKEVERLANSVVKKAKELTTKIALESKHKGERSMSVLLSKTAEGWKLSR